MQPEAQLELLQRGLSAPEAALLRRAFDIAVTGHCGQTRDDGRDYVVHPLNVALLLRNTLGVTDARVLAAAILHDVAEDTEIGLDSLAADFPVRTVELVQLVTDPHPHMSSDERRAHYEAIWPDPEALLLKCADRLDNLSDALRTGGPAKQLHYAQRTRNEMFRPGCPAGEHPIAGPLLRAAVESCESPSAGSPADGLSL